jgi:hypothetical protein
MKPFVLLPLGTQVPRPPWDFSLSDPSRGSGRSRRGAQFEHLTSVWVPEPALGLLPSRALSSAQVPSKLALDSPVPQPLTGLEIYFQRKEVRFVQESVTYVLT